MGLSPRILVWVQQSSSPARGQLQTPGPPRRGDRSSSANLFACQLAPSHPVPLRLRIRWMHENARPSVTTGAPQFDISPRRSPTMPWCLTHMHVTLLLRSKLVEIGP